MYIMCVIQFLCIHTPWMAYKTTSSKKEQFIGYEIFAKANILVTFNPSQMVFIHERATPSSPCKSLFLNILLATFT